MTNQEQTIHHFPGAVVKIIDEFRVVINRGSEHGISVGDRFLIYHIDQEELIDPETNTHLGNLEIVRGTGKASHVQEKITTIFSDRKSQRRRTIKRSTNPFLGHGFGTETETIEEPDSDITPFDDPEIGDKVKPV